MSSFFTHMEATDSGERTTMNQSQRCKALPISSCHCWAPWMSVSLYHTGI